MLGLRDIALFTVAAILGVENLGAMAGVGASTLIWCLFFIVFFMAPFALISAELGTTYPVQGGIYAWVKDAFGCRWASRVTWLYWSNVSIWVPAMFVMFCGVFSQLFFPEMPMAWQVAIGLALCWLSVLINITTLELGKWVPNLGAVLKVVVFIFLIGGSVVYYLNTGTMANEVTWETLTPSWGSALQYIPAYLYWMVGFELVSCGGEEIQNPKRDIPRAIFLSAFIVAALYILSIMAFLVAVPIGEVDLVEGLIDTLVVLFGSSGVGSFVVTSLGIAILYSFFSSGVTWSLGANRAIAESAIDGEMPAFLGREHAKLGTPVGAAIAGGGICTVVLVLYGTVAASNEDLFWTLFAFSAVLFFLPYIGMVLAFLKLRVVDAATERPFRVPGGTPVARIASVMCLGCLLFSIALLMYVPGEGIVWEVVIGVFAILLLGELFIRSSEKKEAVEAATNLA